MSVSEFDLIERFFKRRTNFNHPVSRLGIGDDCALLSIPPGYQLAVTTDTMVENVHFLPDVNPEWLGYKLLAVNLSDLASMGAEPAAMTLALTLPAVDEVWLQGFAQGFLRLAQHYAVDLLGGDTTSGPLTLTMQAMGIIPQGAELLRSSALPGDHIYISGNLGDAGLGLKIAKRLYRTASTDQSEVLKRFHQPEPRVAIGLAIRQYANACIDVSDGLAADLRHILELSGVGACIEWEQLPLSMAVSEYITASGDWTMPMLAGDDYELCFTVAAGKTVEFESDMCKLGYSCTHIGMIEEGSGLRLNRLGSIKAFTAQGYEHFSSFSSANSENK